MKRSLHSLSVLLVVTALATPAMAGVNFSVDVLWSPRADDDVQVYLHASNVAYPMPRERVVSVWQEIRYPDRDYPVLAFIAHHARVDIRMVWSYRKSGHSWYEVMRHCELPPDVLFVELDRDPGPPYGKAYGHWRKRGDRVRPRYINDDDVRFWVGLHTAAIYSDTTIDKVSARFRDGDRPDRVIGDHYRARHVRPAKKDDRGYDKQHRKGRGNKHKDNKKHRKDRMQ